MIPATTQRPTATRHRPFVATSHDEVRPQVLVVGDSPAGLEPVRSMMGEEVEVEHAAEMGRALERCLAGNVELLFVNLFHPRPSELTALALFRQARPDQYVAVCAEPSLIPSLEQAGLADALFILEPAKRASNIM